MKSTEKQLLDLLSTIKGNGNFATSSVKKFTPPGLSITGVGEIGFPVSPVQIKDIIKVARKAPFGKGSQTVTDVNVRSAWEIDASCLSFRGEDWEPMLADVLTQVQEGLGLHALQNVQASLYKLLVYEKGDFFLSHKDSEKEPGMFGTLVIGLPSAHTGGELVVQFDNRAETIDFSIDASSYKIPFAAFFADCDHELKPVTSGFRVCLVYNLLQSPSAAKIGGPKFSAQVNQMTALLKSSAASFGDTPKAVILGHQYTAANFSLSQLKLDDRPRAESLIEAARKAGYFAALGLVTHYLSGELEDDGSYYNRRDRRNRYHDDEEDEDTGGGGTMGEVYETSTDVTCWSKEGMPGLGEITLEEEDMITNTELGDGEPIEQDEEGYTGNAGMTIEYWYHYGAVILWPESKHFQLISEATIQTRLEWLNYYQKNWENAALNPREMSEQLLERFIDDDMTGQYLKDMDFSPVAAAFLQLNDKKILVDVGEALLAAVFDLINVAYWVQLLRKYPPQLFDPIFEMAASMQEPKVINHLLDILVALEAPTPDAFLQRQIQQIPGYLANIPLTGNEKEQTNWLSSLGLDDPLPKKVLETAILEKVLVLSRHQETDAAWQQTTAAIITRKLPRKYVNKVLAVVLLGPNCPKNTLAETLRAVCTQQLANRAAQKPVSPSNWCREVPSYEYNSDIWEMLRPFLESPTQSVFEYRRNERDRKQLESTIRHVEVDLQIQTRTTGSPYTLVLTKTLASYERALEDWKEDVALLDKMSQLV